MKSTIVEKVGDQNTKYPCLMVCNPTLVVLFTSHGTGIVVGGNKDFQNISWYSTSWDMNSFKPFNGQVILEN